jgi:hypothetical protein
MAPEVMKGKNHSYTVDFFALGIMGYEFMLGRRPYKGRSRREIKEQMLSKKAQISLKDIPNGWSEESADFFNQLLQRKPEYRLGNKGIWQLKQHRWLKYFPWDQLINKELESPFIPEKKDNFDRKYCEANDTVNIETLLRYEQYKKENEYNKYFINFTFYRIISENVEEKNEQTSLSKSNSNSLNNSFKNDDINSNEKNTIKDKEQNMATICSNEDTETNNILYDKVKITDSEIKKNKTSNHKINQEKKPNISSNKTLKSISFMMKLSEKNNDNNKLNNNIVNIVNNNTKKDISNQKNSLILKNDNSLDDSCNIKNINYKNNKKKNIRAKTPLFNEKRKILLERNNKKIESRANLSKSIKRNHSSNNRFLNNRLIMSQNKYSNYRENIRNLISQKAKKIFEIYSPGYFSKNSFQTSNNSSKMNTIMVRRKNNSELSKTPMSSISKSPKITMSTSNSNQGYKHRSKSVSPLIKSQEFLRHNSTAKLIHKDYLYKRNSNSKINLNNLYNQNFSYAKRIKEMNSFNYANRMMNNISNVKNKNNKKANEIISSYSISSSSILKQIRNTNYYHQNKNNANKYNINNNKNQIYSYKNINRNNQRMKQNNKISVELELNADCQGFNKYNNNKNENKSQKRKINSNVSIKNNIINKNSSTINIGSMKMAMNGNININVVIKGNNNTTNLINKLEIKKKKEDSARKNASTNNKKMIRSYSNGLFNLNYI